MLYVALQRVVDDQYDISTLLNLELVVVVELVFVHLDGLTRGAAETLYKVTGGKKRGGEDVIPLHRRSLKTISLECDTIYFSDVRTDFRRLANGCGCCMFFHHDDAAAKPIFLYINIDSNGDATT